MRNRHDTSSNLNLQLFMPGSGWSAPEQFPCLSGAKRIGLDLETCDPALHSRGPGSIRKDGKVVGISVATDDAGWYLPFAHLGGGNMDKEAVVGFIRDLLSRVDLECVGANIIYELEWLDSLGIVPRAKFYDVQIAEALLDEERDDGFDLGTLSTNYLGQMKDEKLLREAAEAFCVDPKSGLWKLPAQFVGPYAIFDAIAPLQIFEKQEVQIRAQGLEGIFDLETRLTPILWMMRKQGIPVDLSRARESSKELMDLEQHPRMDLRRILGLCPALCGTDVDPWSGKDLAHMCDELKINYPRTPKGNPSFEGDFLEKSEHPALQAVSSIRELDRLRKTFIDDWIFGNQINGRVHPVWKQLKSDDGGTRTGRMAAAYPNPQQVPARSGLAHLIRRIFVPEEGRDWCKIDYSQQEPRLLVHYASLCGLTGADLVKMAYKNDPRMDIYQFIADAAKLSRKDAKNTTLGRMYGMGYRKFAKMYGMSEDAARSLLEGFDAHVPFVKELADKVSGQASRRGYVRTLGGRKRHFNYWEPVDAKSLRDRGVNCLPVMHHDAIKKWPNSRLQRAHTHKALNSLIQGSAADMIKRALVNLYEGHKIVPYMAVHDETNTGVVDQAQGELIQKTMEEVYPLSVPVRSEMSIGKSWAME